MKKNNGFTLIELLAVIVILAIISIIAVPIVLNIIDTARRGSAESSANGYIDAVEYYASGLELKGKTLMDGTYDVADLDVKIGGKKPAYGTVTIKKGIVESADICINGYIVEHKNNKSKSHSTCTGEADDVKPILTIGEIKKTTNRIEINFTAKDLESGIKNTTCEYGTTKEYGKTGKLESITNGPCIIENANQDTTYHYKITTIDKNKNETTVSSNTSTEIILKPIVTSDPNWSTNKVVNIEYKGTGITTPAYFIKSTVNTTSDNNVKACTGNLPKTASECTGESTKEITKDIWYLVSGTEVNITLNENGSIYTSTSDGFNMVSAEVYTVTKIDKTEPELVSTLSVTTKTDRATLSMECSDESGITKYEFSKDEGKTWVNNGESNSYTFKDLTQTTDYKFIGRCTNGAGLVTASNKDGKTSSIIAPTISADSNWSTSKVVNIEYNGSGIETPVYFMKSTVNTTSDNNVKACTGNQPKTASECTGESTKEITKDIWYLVSGTEVNITLNENGSIYAYTSDGQNLASSNVYTVTTIDKTEPELVSTLSVTTKTDRATLSMECSDESGITKYEFSKDEGKTWVNNGTSNSYTFKDLSQTTDYKFVGRCTNGSGLITASNKDGKTSSIIAPTISADTSWSTSKIVNIEYNGSGIENPVYFMKSTVNTTSDINVTSCTGSLPKTASECTGTSTKEITKDIWYLVSGTKINLTLNENGSIYAYTSDGQNLASSNVYTVTTIDKTEPTLSIGTLTKTTKKITIPFTVNDPESDIKNTTCSYGTSTSYGSAGTISGNSCVINNISTDTTYYYKITTTNNAGLIKEEIGSTNVVKPTVTFTQTPEASVKATSKDITVTFTATGITAPTYYIKSTINTTSNINAYSCGTSTMPGTCSASATKNITANTWYKVATNPVLTLTDNGSIYGLINDGESYLTAQTTTITSIIKNASEVYFNNSTFTNGENMSVQEALENLYDMTV